MFKILCMAKIRYLNFFDFLSVKKLTSLYTEDNFFSFTSALLSQPIALLNRILPVPLKFYPDYYVAIHKGKLKAMLSIKPKRKNNSKWRITKLLLDENAYETGEQLINYVVAKYGASGVETIEVEIKSDEEDMIDLFSKTCGFRYCLDYQIYKLNKDYFTNTNAPKNCLFRPFKSVDSKAISELYNGNILPYYKFSLSKTPKEFEDSIFAGLSKHTVFKYIMEDKYTKQIRGYLQISTDTSNNFLIETLFLESYENYIEDAINFALSQILKRSNESTIFFRNCKFHSNSREIEEFIKKTDSEIIRKDMIFVKDFFKQIKEDEKLIKPAIIYNDINGKPVYKI